MQRILIAATCALALSACSTTPQWSDSTESPASIANGVLVGPNGRTLYTFDKDVANSGASACYAQCATNWPPLMATFDGKAAGPWSLIDRTGGGRQWAYKGRPLYYWSKDEKAGDRSGDGVGNAWRIARP